MRIGESLGEDRDLLVIENTVCGQSAEASDAYEMDAAHVAESSLCSPITPRSLSTLGAAIFRMEATVADECAAGADAALAIRAEVARGGRCADNYGGSLVRRAEVRHGRTN